MCSILCFIGVRGKSSDLIIPIFLALLSTNSQKQKRNNLSGSKIDQEQSTGQGGPAEVAWFWFGKGRKHSKLWERQIGNSC